MLTQRAAEVYKATAKLPGDSMLSKIKATILDYFDLGQFSASNTKIAKATNEQDDPLAFVVVEKVLMVSAATVNSQTTPSEQKQSGDAMEAEIIKAALKQGATRLLIVAVEGHEPPPDEEWEELRVYSRKLPRTTLRTSAVHFIH
jgi:hypothetical protein